MNQEGQIIITDLLLYLIILTIVLGLIIFIIVTLDDNQVTRINVKQLDSLADNCLDTLTKSSGKPSNWECFNKENVQIVGLKSNNNNFISYDKLIKLKNNNQLLDNCFPDEVSYQLVLYSKSNPNNQMIIADKSFSSNKKEIISKSIFSMIDYGFDIIPLGNNNEYCYYNHDNNWTCKSFTVTKNLLNKGNYYITTNSNSGYILSNTYSENITDVVYGTTNINEKLKQLLNGENETIYLHVNTKENTTYLIYDKNNREEFIKYIIKPEIYVLNLKLAI